MGLDIRRNRKGLYQVKSTMSDKVFFNGEWVTEERLKKFLIVSELHRSVDKMLEIYHDFPSGWFVNDKLVRGDRKHDQWMLDEVYKSDDSDEVIMSEFDKACKELDIKIKMGFDEE